MKIFVIGGGGREHALAWKISKSKLVEKIYVYPGNPGVSSFAEIPDLSDDKPETLRFFAKKEKIDLTVVGPEKYLAAGITDIFTESGLKIFGPTKSAAQIESSKIFAKDLMQEAGIPTADYYTAKSEKEALESLERMDFPCVLKADGLAAGKGVLIPETKDEARKYVSEIFAGRFSDAGRRVVIEEFLEGEELSLLVFTDGKTFRPMLFSQDHKAAYEGDKGPNTGGMGAYTPVSIASKELYESVRKKILEPLFPALEKRGITYKGVLYAGLMITNKEPYVLEFNVRFGDPEAEVLLFNMKSDIVPSLVETAAGNLESAEPFAWHEGYAVCVVMASKGYPGNYEKGHKISIPRKTDEDTFVFHAGTVENEKGQIVTAGGRVLMVTSRGETVENAVKKAYDAAEQIKCNNLFFRKDIAHRELNREKNED